MLWSMGDGQSLVSSDAMTAHGSAPELTSTVALLRDIHR